VDKSQGKLPTILEEPNPNNTGSDDLEVQEHFLEAQLSAGLFVKRLSKTISFSTDINIGQSFKILPTISETLSGSGLKSSGDTPRVSIPMFVSSVAQNNYTCPYEYDGNYASSDDETSDSDSYQGKILTVRI